MKRKKSILAIFLTLTFLLTTLPANLSLAEKKVFIQTSTEQNTIVNTPIQFTVFPTPSPMPPKINGEF